MDGSIRVAVLGASGFSGGELIRLLHDHPRLKVTFAGAKGSVGETVGGSHPHLAGLPAGGLVLQAMEPAAIAAAADLVFAALPNGTSSAIGARAPRRRGAGDRPRGRLPSAGRRLSPLVRVRPSARPRGSTRRCTGCPSCSRDRVPRAKLVANPGCFATAAIMSCAPHPGGRARRAGHDPRRRQDRRFRRGAGGAPSRRRSARPRTRSARTGSRAHQHTPEIERGIELATGRTVRALFVPHLVPTVRGVRDDLLPDAAAGVTTEALTECLAAAYAGEPFVRVLRAGRDGRREAHPRHEPDRAPGGRRPAHRHGGGRRRRRQPGEGRGRPGDPEREPVDRVPEATALPDARRCTREPDVSCASTGSTRRDGRRPATADPRAHRREGAHVCSRRCRSCASTAGKVIVRQVRRRGDGDAPASRRRSPRTCCCCSPPGSSR